jgi:hypothetical protein
MLTCAHDPKHTADSFFCGCAVKQSAHPTRNSPPKNKPQTPIPPYDADSDLFELSCAQVVLIGDTFDETSKWAREQSEERGMPYIPPFDHPLVIAGQGTIGMELLRQSSTIGRRP